MVREARIGIGDTNCPSDIVQNGRHQAQLPFITSMKQQTRTRKLWHQIVGVGMRVLCTILSNSREPWSTSERHHHLGSAVQFSFRPRRCNGNSFIAITILLSRGRMQEKSICAESKRFASLLWRTRQDNKDQNRRRAAYQQFPAKNAPALTSYFELFVTKSAEEVLV